MNPGTFYGSLSSAFPSQINIDVTEFCNLACIHCPYEAVTKTKGVNRRNLDPDLHRKLIDEIADAGAGVCRYIRYTGEGEPLLHPQLAEMIGYAVRTTGLPTNLTTNGMLLNRRRIDQLLDAGVAIFDISLDAASAEVYAGIRVNGDLSVARSNVEALIERNRTLGCPAKVVVSFVRQPANEHEAEAFRAMWTAAGADAVVVRSRHSCAGSIEAVAEELWAAAPARRLPCLYPWERLIVGPTGRFSFCPADWLHEAELGALESSTVVEVWQGPAMRRLREAHLSGNYSEHAFCGKCPDWSVINWPDSGPNYASLMSRLAPVGGTGAR
ncbi:radical SAM/SPASM domain-containing protein [Azospirillum sp. ST 5-10]|uniref:radical SAM/SPASM domain-containing protein n=1 Tax=unclassified Azospirillum TaxID=2630922 RepID=UPI003F49DE0D